MRLFLKHPISILTTYTAIMLYMCEAASAGNRADLDWRETSDSSLCSGYYEKIVIDSGEEISASADKANHVEGGSTTFKGNVVVTHEKQELRADSLTIERSTETYTAKGKAQLDILHIG